MSRRLCALCVSRVSHFRESAVPEEIISVRTVRAMRDGADGYGLMQSHDSPVFEFYSEALWGGYLTSHEQRLGAGRVVHVERFAFGRRLRRGERHEFAVRSWVDRSDADTAIALHFSLPTELATLRLNFYGGRQPASVWSFGPIPDEAFLPTSAEDGVSAPVHGRAVQVDFRRPVAGRTYGIAWAW